MTIQTHGVPPDTALTIKEFPLQTQGFLKYAAGEEVPEVNDLYSAQALGTHLESLDEPPFSLIAVGDIMLGGRTRRAIKEHGDDYPFEAVLPLLQRADIILGNLEGPFALTARKENRNYSYRVSPKLASSLKRAGINVVTLANNHLLDCGRAGVLETLDTLAEADIASIGAGVDEKAAHAPVILQSGPWRVGFLGYYWNQRTSATSLLPGSAMDTLDSLKDDILALREQVDRIVVTFHWGVPYEVEPSSEDRAKARFAVDCGADVVVGHHPHIIQPFEIYRDCPIFYSVGNFTFGSGNSRAESLLVGFQFEERHTKVTVYPIYVKNRDPRVNYQPKALQGLGAERILRRLAAISGPNGSLLEIQEEHGRGTMEIPWSRRCGQGKKEPHA